jgi:hypothetical protein
VFEIRHASTARECQSMMAGDQVDEALGQWNIGKNTVGEIADGHPKALGIQIWASMKVG